jgi:hypothetical protein
MSVWAAAYFDGIRIRRLKTSVAEPHHFYAAPAPGKNVHHFWDILSRPKKKSL